MPRYLKRRTAADMVWVTIRLVPSHASRRGLGAFLEGAREAEGGD